MRNEEEIQSQPNLLSLRQVSVFAEYYDVAVNLNIDLLDQKCHQVIIYFYYSCTQFVKL